MRVSVTIGSEPTIVKPMITRRAISIELVLSLIEKFETDMIVIVVSSADADLNFSNIEEFFTSLRENQL